jgi:CRP-like cAMP-binding protein
MPQRTTDEIITLVRTNILFRGVSNRTIAKLAHKLVKQAVKAGEIIFDESTAGREIYLICSGRVRIRKYTRYSPEATLALLHPGDFFGELSVIDELQRSARAEAVEDSVIVRLDAAEFREMIRTSYAFTFNLLNNLAIRLRSIDKVFIQEMERNALAAKTKMDRLNSLIEASKTVNSTIEIDRLLTLIIDAAARSISADRGTLYLLDRSTNELWSKVTQGENMVEIRLPAGKGLAGYVAQTGDVVNIPDAYKDPRFNPEIDRKTGYKTYNVLCMPMRDKEGRIVGVFQFLNKESGPFTDDDAAFIDALSVHAAIAVENARIAAEMVRTERLSAVGRMASSIIHDIKNPMGALRMYAQIIKTKTDNKEAARIADEMIRQVDRFVSMTQEILDFSRGISEMHVDEGRCGSLSEGPRRRADDTQDRSRAKLSCARDHEG